MNAEQLDQWRKLQQRLRANYEAARIAHFVANPKITKEQLEKAGIQTR